MSIDETTVLSVLANRMLGVPKGALSTMTSIKFSLTSTGTVITAVPFTRFKVCAAKLIVSAAISVNWRSTIATPAGTTSTELEGAQAFAANGGSVECVTPPAFLFTTDYGASLDLLISGAGTVAGRLTYWLETPPTGS